LRAQISILELEVITMSQTRGPYTYIVTATGLGGSFNTYPMKFEMLSNYDYAEEENKERIFNRAQKEAIQRNGGQGVTKLKIRKKRK